MQQAMSTGDLLELADIADLIEESNFHEALPRLFKLASLYPENLKVRGFITQCLDKTPNLVGHTQAPQQKSKVEIIQQSASENMALPAQGQPKLRPIVCPNCGSANQIQKVSSIVASGVSTSVSSSFGTVGFGGDMGFTVSRTRTRMSSILAQRLAAPQAPTFDKSTAFFLALIGFSCLFLSLCLFFSSISVLSPASATEYEPASVPLCLFFSSISVLSLLFIPGGIFFFYMAWKNNEVEVTNYNNAVARYRENYYRWNELYFCHRDDLVFDIWGEIVTR